MTATLLNYEIKTIGKSRNAPRIWLQGRQPEKAGFSVGRRYQLKKDENKKTITLTISDEGNRIVSRKLINGNEQPLIDINSNEVLGIFHGMDRVRIVTVNNCIYIMPLASEVRKSERLNRLHKKIRCGEPLSIGSISHGGGVLSLALHKGLETEGISSKLAFANEIREDLLVHASTSNPVWNQETLGLIAPMQEFVFDEWAMGKLPTVDILEAGIPCTGASLSGRSKNGINCAEAHEQVGHLVVAFLNFVAKANPVCVVLENVPLYQNTSSMWIIRHQLRDLGYELHEIILEGKEFNSIEHRSRLCLVAVTQGLEFEWAHLQKPHQRERSLSEVLEQVGDEDSMWSEMQYLKDKEVRDREAGKGFVMQIANHTTTKVGAIGTGYSKNRSTEIKVQHQDNPNLLRLLTPVEHARCKGIPEEIIEGLSKTTAHELLGQSIIFDVFVAVGRLLAKSLTSVIIPAQAQFKLVSNF